MKRSRIYSSNLAPGSGSLPNTSSKHEHLKRLDVLTLFPAMFEGPMSESLLGRAGERGIVKIRIHNLREWSGDQRHHAVDDRPFGGGPGMVLQVEPIYQALKALRADGARVFGKKAKPHVVYLSPQGSVLTQAKAGSLSKRPWVILLCGHYEGIDERAMRWVDEEISIGDYVLTGGEIPAMVLADVVVRLVPGVVKEPGSIAEESFQGRHLDYPHFTRPSVWKGRKVPAVLLSGDHAAIRQWRAERAREATRKKRPELLRKANGRKR